MQIQRHSIITMFNFLQKRNPTIKVSPKGRMHFPIKGRIVTSTIILAYHLHYTKTTKFVQFVSPLYKNIFNGSVRSEAILSYKLFPKAWKFVDKYSYRSPLTFKILCTKFYATRVLEFPNPRARQK